MAINAYEKFKNSIAENIGDNIVSSRIVNDEVEIQDMLKKISNGGYSLEAIKCQYRLGKIEALEEVYDSGLIRLRTHFICKGKSPSNKEEIINQISIFSSYNEKPLVNLVVKPSAKSFKQLLVKSSPANDIFNRKDVFINNVSIQLQGESYYGAEFETYIKYDDNSLMLEKYRQWYPLTKDEYLIRLCGCGDRNLEIIYENDNPIYAELSDKYNVEMAGFNPNNRIDAKYIVNIINEEVDAICNVIKTNLIENSIKQNETVNEKQYIHKQGGVNNGI